LIIAGPGIRNLQAHDTGFGGFVKVTAGLMSFNSDFENRYFLGGR
jgi:hypothetical protein